MTCNVIDIQCSPFVQLSRSHSSSIHVYCYTAYIKQGIGSDVACVCMLILIQCPCFIFSKLLAVDLVA